jgi:hypothetical protein
VPEVSAPAYVLRAVDHGSVPEAPASISALPVVPAVVWPLVNSSHTSSTPAAESSYPVLSFKFSAKLFHSFTHERNPTNESSNTESILL